MRLVHALTAALSLSGIASSSSTHTPSHPAGRPVSPLRVSHIQALIDIAKIEAHLVYQFGDTSANIIGPHPWVLWNTIIGEGEAKRPSRATLVVVVVRGPRTRALPRAKVRLSISGRWPLRDSMETALVPFDASGVQRVPFHLAHTGCDSLHLIARLMPSSGARASVSARSADIAFNCGE